MEEGEVVQGVMCGSTPQTATFYTKKYFTLDYRRTPNSSRDKPMLNLGEWYKLLLGRNNSGGIYVADYTKPNDRENQDPTKVDIFVENLRTYKPLKEWTCSIQRPLRLKSHFFVTPSYRTVKEVYLGEVAIDPKDLNQLKSMGIEKFDAIAEIQQLDSRLDDDPAAGPHFMIKEYHYEGKEFSLNGWLSKSGKLMRGKGGVVLHREQAQVPPDALIPKVSTRPSRFSAENSNSIYNNKQQRVLEQRQEQQYLAGVAEGLLRTTPVYDHSFNEESHSSLSLSESKPFSFQSDSQVDTTNSSISDNILGQPVHASTPLASDYEDDELVPRYSSGQGHEMGAQQTETERHSQMLHQRQDYEQQLSTRLTTSSITSAPPQRQSAFPPTTSASVVGSAAATPHQSSSNLPDSISSMTTHSVTSSIPRSRGPDRFQRKILERFPELINRH